MYFTDMVIHKNFDVSVDEESFPSQCKSHSSKSPLVLEPPNRPNSTMGKNGEVNNLKRRNPAGKQNSAKFRLLSDISSSCCSATTSAAVLHPVSKSSGIKDSLSKDITGQKKKIANTGKKKKIDLTLDWLDENYTICEGVCLARCILYSHYKDFCGKNGLEPSCAATFGKTIRQKFPRVTTRRLGMRGHSKYHYYGIGIRETSVYYNLVYAGKGLTRYSAKGKPENEPYFSCKIKMTKENLQDTFLDEVPDISIFSGAIGNSSLLEQIRIVVNFYKSLCRQTLVAGENKDFKSVSCTLLQCWSNAPFQQFPNLLHNNLAIDLVTLCDALLHEALIDVLLPLPSDEIEERHLTEIGNLSKQWEEFLKSAVASPVSSSMAKKKTLAQQFSQFLMRHVSFIKLNRAVKSIFGSAATFLPMRNDLEKINLHNSLGSSTLYSATSEERPDSSINEELLKELKDLVKKNATVGMLVGWLDSVVDEKVIKPSKQNGRSLKKRANDFLLKWSFFGARITHNLNNTNASSFNSFHYLRMFLVEYVMLAIETQFNNEKRVETRKAVAKHSKITKANLNANHTSKTSKQVYYPESNIKRNYKSNFVHEEPLKRWDPYENCKHYFPVYEPFPKTELPHESYSQPYFDSHAYVVHGSYANQSDTTGYSSLLHSAGYEETMTSNSPIQKRNETVVYENGSSFTNLNCSSKPESFANFHHLDDFYSSKSNQRSSSSNSFKEVSFYNSLTLDNKKLNLESYSVSNNFATSPSTCLEKRPLGKCRTKLEQSPSSFSEVISPSQLCLPKKSVNISAKNTQDLSYPGYQGVDFSFFSDPQNKNEFTKQPTQNGFRILEEFYSPTHTPNNSFISMHSNDDPFLHNINCLSNYDESTRGTSWTGPVAHQYDDRGQLNELSSDSASHRMLYQENLPSIASVLTPE